MAEEHIILFDIPSKEPRRAWSFNVWRGERSDKTNGNPATIAYLAPQTVRLLLNYKKIPYKTEWVCF